MLYKKNIFLILYIFIFLIFFETFSYLILPDSRLNKLESILRIIEEDQILFWKQRPYLNTKFQGANIVTNSSGFRNREIDINKDVQIYRIICLGASPTFGWGVDLWDTYPFLLEQKLKKNSQSKNIEVINASQIGYTTYQGVILFKERLLKYSPNLITVSYVLNDIDRYRFIRNEGLSDKELHMPNFLTIKIKNILLRNRSYLIFKKYVTLSMNKSSRLAINILKKQFDLAKVRVSSTDFKINLEKIINLCKAHNIRIVLIKMPINLSLPHLTDDEHKILNNGKSLSEFYYEIGCNYEKIGEYKNAQNSFKKAKDYLVFDCYRDGIIYQGLLEETAYNYNVPLVDVAAVFNRIRNQNLFVGPHDPIHPNSIGHKFIADAIYKAIINYSLLE